MGPYSELRRVGSKQLNLQMAKKISCIPMAPASGSSQMEGSAKLTQMDEQRQKPGDLYLLVQINVSY